MNTYDYSSLENVSTRTLLQSYVKLLRTKIKKNNKPENDKILFTDKRKGFLNGEYVTSNFGIIISSPSELI